jgi:hypothetical protein
MPRVLPGRPQPTSEPIQQTYHVERRLTVGGEPVHIPSRIYHDPMAPSDVLTALFLKPVQRTILACLYTRHHDGRVRQNWLRTIAASTEPWVAPFVVNPNALCAHLSAIHAHPSAGCVRRPPVSASLPHAIKKGPSRRGPLFSAFTRHGKLARFET